MADSTEPTSYNLEIIKQQIRMISDSKTIHTRNKACFYLEQWKYNKEKFDKLYESCLSSILTNNWKPVTEMLRKYW